MKKVISLNVIIAITLSVLTGCSSSNKSASKSPENATAATVAKDVYTTNKLTPYIDGQATDWAAGLLNYDKTTKAKYAIANDANNIYVVIIASDMVQQMKMINGGAEVWISTDMKKSKVVGVKFPIGGGSMQPPNRGGGTPNQEQMKSESREKMRNMELKGFKTDFNGVQSVYSTSQVKPAIDWNNQREMVYELAIPFSALQSADISNINVGIFFKGLRMPDGMPGGGGGMPPAGMTPSGGGGGMPDMEQIRNLSNEDSFWTKYTVVK